MRTAIVKMDGCQYQVEVCTRITRLHPQGAFSTPNQVLPRLQS